MSLQTLMRALRTPLLLATAALVAVAAPAAAILGLPVGLPSTGHRVDTPAGYADVSASEQGADVCYDLATPALPAAPSLPSLPVPLPVSVPAIDTSAAYAGSKSCVSAGLDGASADIGVDAAGSHVGTGLSAESPVSQAQIDQAVAETQGEAQGFLDHVIDTLFGWI